MEGKFNPYAKTDDATPIHAPAKTSLSENRNNRKEMEMEMEMEIAYNDASSLVFL